MRSPSAGPDQRPAFRVLPISKLEDVDVMHVTDDSRYHIDVSVVSEHLPEQSQPGADRYAFSYTVTIQNTGLLPARLLNRRWIVSDAHGKIQEVRGKGVVGEQPYLKPGESYRYTSGTVIQTPVGSMEGSYEMEADDGTRFEAAIPAFSLATPTSLH
jgi:ApaG protein